MYVCIYICLGNFHIGKFNEKVYTENFEQVIQTLEIAQWANCLLREHEGLYPNFSHLHKIWVWSRVLVTTLLGDGASVFTGQLIHSAETMSSSRVQIEILSQ